MDAEQRSTENSKELSDPVVVEQAAEEHLGFLVDRVDVRAQHAPDEQFLIITSTSPVASTAKA